MEPQGKVLLPPPTEWKEIATRTATSDQETIQVTWYYNTRTAWHKIEVTGRDKHETTDPNQAKQHYDHPFATKA